PFSKGIAKIAHEHDLSAHGNGVEMPQGTPMDIDHRIHELAERGQPVTRLVAPWRRAARWLAASLAYVGIVVAACLLAGGGLPRSIEPGLIVELSAILATGVAAAIAAFSSVVPGRD